MSLNKRSNGNKKTVYSATGGVTESFKPLDKEDFSTLLSLF